MKIWEIDIHSENTKGSHDLAITFLLWFNSDMLHRKLLIFYFFMEILRQKWFTRILLNLKAAYTFMLNCQLKMVTTAHKKYIPLRHT